MLPVVALVGRPNVGKSTLFNQLTRSRDALVADEPGVTRDRRYGIAVADGGRFLVVDTGGIGAGGPGEIASAVERQVSFALEEADAIVLVVDHREGLTAEDERIAASMRRSGKPVAIAVNKAEGVPGAIAEADFQRLGFKQTVAIAALHGRGIGALTAIVLEPFDLAEAAEAEEGRVPRIAVIGRPNVGKSTLINRLIGRERLITSPEPGTTHDSVLVPCERDGHAFVLVDTAGIRRRARVSDAIEKFSIIQSLKAVQEADVVIVLADAREGLTDQDLHLVGLVGERGGALVIGMNKWDGLTATERRRVEAQVDRQLDFVPYAAVLYLSALHGSGIAEVVEAAMSAYEAAGRELPTARLNEILERLLRAHAPPVSRGRQIRLRYAHQGGRFPPLVIIHGSQAERTPAHYRRYLENEFRKALRIRGTPVKIEFRSGENPFAGRRNTLTPRQARRRQRLIKHDRRKR